MFHKVNKLLLLQRHKRRILDDTNIPKTDVNRATALQPQPQPLSTYTDVSCPPNTIKQAIFTNDPIEDKLNVIIVVSNACLYARRYVLLREFVARIERDESDMRLFTVELAYGDQEYAVTSSNNPRHLQLRTAVPLWHKENMINIAVKRLLVPLDYKAFAWIDADVEFDSPTWAMDTLKILNGTCDVIQLFSHCCFMARDTSIMEVFTSFGFSFVKDNPTMKCPGPNYWHPGFAWAMTRAAFEQMGGLFEIDIVGGTADTVLSRSLSVGIGNKFAKATADYKAKLAEFEKNAQGLQLGYTPGIVLHFFHGTRENRKYLDRENTIAKFGYSPSRDIAYDAQGVIVPTYAFPPGLREQIMRHFQERKEDD